MAVSCSADRNILAKINKDGVWIEKLEDNPELVNSDPYGEGWMIKVKMTNPSEVGSLLDAEAYKALIA